MAVNKDTIRLEAAMRRLIADALDAHDTRLIATYGQAWMLASREAEAIANEVALLIAEGNATRAKLWRNRRMQQGLAALTKAMQDVLDEAMADAIDAHTLEAAADVQRAMIASQLQGKRLAGIRADLSRADPEQIEAIVERTTQQITKAAKPLPFEAQQAMRRELVRAVTMGRNPRDAARDMVRGIEDRWNGGLTRAMTIARTEQLDAYRAASQHVEQANADVLAGWEWHATLSARTCRSCIAMHGTRHDLDEEGPTDHQNGRCARVPVTKTWAELGFKGITEPKPSTPDADRWFAGLPESDQRELLTDKGYEAWKAGDYPREQWTTTRTVDGWRDSQVPSAPPKG